MVMFWGDRGLEAVRDFEKSQDRLVQIHTFRKLSAILDPSFMEPVLTVMRSSRVTMGHFSGAVVKAAKMQWYSWHVLHPELPVHTERRMSLRSVVVCCHDECIYGFYFRR